LQHCSQKPSYGNNPDASYICIMEFYTSIRKNETMGFEDGIGGHNAK
jgi:hypothetical protein